MKIPRHLLDNANIGHGLRVQEIAHRQAGRDVKRTLRKRPDGTLEFMNGTPVRAGELVPGNEYAIILGDPKFGEKK